MSPFDATDLTFVIRKEADVFVLFRSPDSAEHSPDYREVSRFATRALAEEHLELVEEEE
jgi:hypothetical protein